MATEATNRTNSGKTSRVSSLKLARLIMTASWASALVLAWTTVVSVDIRWRLIGMLLSVFVLAPTLVLAFRQIALELPFSAKDELDQLDSRPANQDIRLEDDQLGIYVDQLTGLASKRYLTMFLQREINRSERSHTPLSVAIFDVDEFHKLQEQVGMKATATGLADIGSRLKSILREYDLVARYAAGRLALVLPETDAHGAAEVVERLHQLAISVCINGKPPSVTVGLSTFPEHGANAEELIQSAHRALNRGKSAVANAVHTLDELKKAS